MHPAQQVRPASRLGPEPLGVAAVLVDDDARQRLEPGGHRAGNRWTAGGVAHIVANSSGSAAAIAAGSSVPKPVEHLAGPRNACSIGYCWSSIIPTSSANGSSVRTWSACVVAG